MDIKRKKSAFQKHRRKIMIAGAAAVGLVGLYWLNSEFGSATLEVKQQLLLTDTVKKGDLDIRVQGHGKLIAKNIQWISAISGGKVEAVLVKPGSSVAKDQVMVRLSNPQLQREAQEQKWNLTALLAEHDAKRVGLDRELLNQEAAVLKAKFEYNSINLEFKAQQDLMEKGQGAVSSVDHDKIKLLSIQLKDIWDIELRKQEKLKVDTEANLKAMDARAKQLKNSLQYNQTQLDALQVAATKSGVVQEVAPQIGQQIESGMSLIKIVDPTDVLAQIEVPEVQASMIRFGQTVKLDLRTTTVDGTVSRIDPSVINGTVKIDVEFDSKSVDGVRPDLSIEGEIIIDELKQINYIRRPSFSQKNNFAKVYVIKGDSGRAQQTEVKFGQASVDKIQVLSGLNPGDVVILNNPTPWLSYQEIQIK